MAKSEGRIFEAAKDRVFGAVLGAVAQLGYLVANTNKEYCTVSFNTGRSMLSWAGQDLTVSVRSVAEVSSGTGASLERSCALS